MRGRLAVLGCVHFHPANCHRVLPHPPVSVATRSGGAFNVIDLHTMAVNDTTVTRSTAGIDGGTFVLTSTAVAGGTSTASTVVLHNVTVTASIARTGTGGVILWEPDTSSVLVVSECALSGAAPESSGGGLAIRATPEQFTMPAMTEHTVAGRALSSSSGAHKPVTRTARRSSSSSFAWAVYKLRVLDFDTLTMLTRLL